MMKTRGLTENDVNRLIELNDLIKSYEKAIKLKDEHRDEYLTILNILKSDWEHIAGSHFPMLESYGKTMDFKTFLRNEKISITKETKNTLKSDSLNDLILKKAEETRLVSSIYDKNYATDIPDPFRKRKRK